jgi:hypothetical protein
LFVDNPHQARVIGWHAVADEPWVHLGADAGTTPAEVSVTFAGAGLPPGRHIATIVLSSPALPGQTVTVHMQAVIPGVPLYLPLIMRTL